MATTKTIKSLNFPKFISEEKFKAQVEKGIFKKSEIKRVSILSFPASFPLEIRAKRPVVTCRVGRDGTTCTVRWR